MKLLLLPACFAAVAAVAADLKDPAEVARDWHRSIDQGRQPGFGQVTGLNGQSDLLTTTPLERIFQSNEPLPPPSAPQWQQQPKLYDAPSSRAPKDLPNLRPKGAIPWEYNGEIYWLVPLAPKPVK